MPHASACRCRQEQGQSIVHVATGLVKFVPSVVPPSRARALNARVEFWRGNFSFESCAQIVNAGPRNSRPVGDRLNSVWTLADGDFSVRPRDGGPADVRSRWVPGPGWRVRLRET